MLAFIVSLPTLNALLTSRVEGAVARGCLAFASSLGPVLLLLATALRSHGFERSLGFAALALLLCGALFAAAERLLPIERRTAQTPAHPLDFIGSAAYAASASLALGLAVAFALRETWLVVGFAIAAAGVALVAQARPIPLLRAMSAALATAALGRVIWSPILTDIGSWPLLNWLIPAYAVPALCFAIGAFALRDRRDRPRHVHEALAAFFAAAFVLLEVRQFFAGSDLVPHWTLIADHSINAPWSRLFAEVVAHVAALGVLGAAFQHLAQRIGGPVFQTSADIAAFALIVLSAAGLGAVLNPLFDGTTVNGPIIINRLLFYVVDGVLLGGLAILLERRRAPSRMSEALSASAALLISLGVVLMVRHAFAGPRLSVLEGRSVGFAEVVIVTLVLLALAAGARIWRDASGSRVAGGVLWILSWLAIGWAALALGLWRNPLFDHSGVAGPILFNRILWGYGAAALGFGSAALWLRRVEPAISRAFTTMAGAGVLLTAFLLIRHGFHGPLLFSQEIVTLAEAGCYAMIGFVTASALLITGSASFGGRRIAVKADNVAGMACGLFALLSGVVANPLMTKAVPVGPIVFDNALVGYGLPALFAFALARWAHDRAASPTVHRLFGGAAIIGGLVYILIEVRRGFVGSFFFWAEIGSTELYTYSAAILLYGVALLALGFRLDSKDLRLASLGVITVAICKVFLVDMAGLEGLLRALSFIGLGTCLVAIGLAYQHLLRRDRARTPAPEQAA